MSLKIWHEKRKPIIEQYNDYVKECSYKGIRPLSYFLYKQMEIEE